MNKIIDYKDKELGWIKAVRLEDIDPLLVVLTDPVQYIKDQLWEAKNAITPSEILRIKKEYYTKGFEVGKKSEQRKHYKKRGGKASHFSTEVDIIDESVIKKDLNL